MNIEWKDLILRLIGALLIGMVVWSGMIAGLTAALNPIFSLPLSPDVQAGLRLVAIVAKMVLLGFLCWVVALATMPTEASAKVGAFWGTIAKPLGVVCEGIGTGIAAVAGTIPAVVKAILGGAKAAPGFAFWTALGVVVGLIAFAATGNLIGNSATSVAQFFADCFHAFVGLLHARVPAYPNPATGLGILVQTLVGIGMLAWVARRRPKGRLALVVTAYLFVLVWPLALEQASKSELAGERSTMWRVVRAIEGSRELGAAKVGQTADRLIGEADTEEYSDVLTVKADAPVFGADRKVTALKDGSTTLPAGTKVRHSVGVEAPAPDRSNPIRFVVVWREVAPGQVETFLLRFDDVEFPEPIGLTSWWAKRKETTARPAQASTSTTLPSALATARPPSVPMHAEEFILQPHEKVCPRVATRARWVGELEFVLVSTGERHPVDDGADFSGLPNGPYCWEGAGAEPTTLWLWPRA